MARGIVGFYRPELVVVINRELVVFDGKLAVELPLKAERPPQFPLLIGDDVLTGNSFAEETANPCRPVVARLRIVQSARVRRHIPKRGNKAFHSMIDGHVQYVPPLHASSGRSFNSSGELAISNNGANPL
jgi:hypothetical protein